MSSVKWGLIAYFLDVHQTILCMYLFFISRVGKFRAVRAFSDMSDMKDTNEQTVLRQYHATENPENGVALRFADSLRGLHPRLTASPSSIGYCSDQNLSLPVFT